MGKHDQKIVEIEQHIEKLKARQKDMDKSAQALLGRIASQLCKNDDHIKFAFLSAINEMSERDKQLALAALTPSSPPPPRRRVQKAAAAPFPFDSMESIGAGRQIERIIR